MPINTNDRLSVRVPQGTKRWLEAIAADDAETISMVVRRILRREVTRHYVRRIQFMGRSGLQPPVDVDVDAAAGSGSVTIERSATDGEP